MMEGLVTPLWPCQLVLQLLIIVLPASYAEHWPACTLAASSGGAVGGQTLDHLASLDVAASEFGCRLSFMPSPPAAERPVVQLHSNAVITGIYNGSVGRPAVVELSSLAAAENASAAAAGVADRPVLAVAPGSSLLLRDLLLANVTLVSPEVAAFLPLALQLPTDMHLKLQDVQMLVSKQQLQQYAAFLQQVPSAVFVTDRATFLHVRSFSSSAPAAVAAAGAAAGAVGTVVDAVSVTLLAQPAESNKTESVVQAAAAAGDAAGVVSTTDSYVLAATNSTLLQLLQQLNSEQLSESGPLLIHLVTNVSLAPRFGGSAWPPGGVVIRRPVMFVGRSWQPTSMDLGMQVGQVVLEGVSANVTLFNVALENLAYGDEANAALADGTSILLPSQLWAFQYRRVRQQLVLWDCTLVLPAEHFIDALVYWASAFASAQQGQSYWRTQTVFMRQSLHFTQFRISNSPLPGAHVIDALAMKDRLVFNTTLTTQPVAAAALLLPFNSSIHQHVATSQAPPAVAPIYSVEELALSLYDIQKACGRVVTLLPLPLDGNRVLSWGRVPALNYSLVDDDPISGEPVPLGAPGTTHAVPHNASDAAAGAAAANSTAGSALEEYGAASVAQQLPASWPPANGPWLVQCPVQFQGTTMLDLGFVKGMFTLQDPSDPPGGSSSSKDGGPDSSRSSSSLGLRVGGRRALMQFAQMSMRGLPQGDLGRSGGNSSGGWSSTWQTAASVGGSSLVSALPAEAYSHLLWFVTRNIAVTNQLSLVNVTLLIPPQEAERLAAAARAAITAASGTNDQPVLSIIYPTAAGPLPVVYRALSVTDSPAASQQARSAAAAADAKELPRHRRLLAAGLAGNAAGDSAGPLTVCVGSMRGLGLLGWNVCMVTSPHMPLPPDYFWYEPFHIGSSDAGGWPSWQTAVVALAVALPVLAAAGLLTVLVRRRRQRKLCRHMQHHLPSKEATPDVSCEACGSGARSGSSGGTAAAASKEQLVSHAAAPGQGPNAQQQQQQQWQQWHNPVLAKLSAAAASRHSVVVDLGAQVALQAGAAAAPVGAGSERQRLVGGGDQQQRLAGAISIVSAGLQARRLVGISSSRSGSIPEANEAASAASGDAGKSPHGSPARGGGAGGAAAAAPKQQMQRQLVKLSIDEEDVVFEEHQQRGIEHVAEPPYESSGNQQAQLTTKAAVNARNTRFPTTAAAAAARVSQVAAQQQLQLHEPIGQGTFGVVFRATWQGIPAAVKLMQLPAAVGDQSAGLGAGRGTSSSREQMAVMEAAVGASINHPNVVQVYTYNLRPMGHLVHMDSCSAGGSGSCSSSADAATQQPQQQQQQQQQRCARHGSGTSCESCGSNATVTGYELQLVMEYCPMGSLRAALDSCLLEDRVTGAPHYATVLGLAQGVACAMHHLHSEGVLHGDLKAGNVLLKLEVGPASAAAAAAGAATPLGPGCGDVLVAKVADLGLACLLDDQDTHISGVHRGTLTHMSPELLLQGRASRASDVYAYGILLWDLATGQRAFQDVPKVLLGASVVRDRLRPAWPGTEAGSGGYPGTTTWCQQQQQEGAQGADGAAGLQPPLGFRRLAEACWAHEPRDRPTFAEVTATLEQLIKQEQQRQAEFEAFAQQLQQQQQQQQQCSAAVEAAPATAARQQSTASSSSTAGGLAGGGGTAASRKVRFSADVDKLVPPSNTDVEQASNVSMSVDASASGGVRKGSGAAAAVAAVLGVRWQRPKASPAAPHAAQVSVLNSSKPVAAQGAVAEQGPQWIGSPFASQQGPPKDDFDCAADQQWQQQHPQPVLGATNGKAGSSGAAATPDAGGRVASTAQKQEVGQAVAAAAAAAAAGAAAPFSPFGDLKDQPWE